MPRNDANPENPAVDDAAQAADQADAVAEQREQAIEDFDADTAFDDAEDARNPDAPHSEHAGDGPDPLAGGPGESDTSVSPAAQVPAQDAPTDPAELLRVNGSGDPVQQGPLTSTKAEDLSPPADAPTGGALYGDVRTRDIDMGDGLSGQRDEYFAGDDKGWVSKQEYLDTQIAEEVSEHDSSLAALRSQVDALRSVADGAHRILYSSDLRLVVGLFDLMFGRAQPKGDATGMLEERGLV